MTVDVAVADEQMADTLREVTSTAHLAIRALVVCTRGDVAVKQ